MSTTTHRDENLVALDDAEQIDDVRHLEVGDRVRMDGRERPLTVIQTGTRVIETLLDGAENRIQHAVQLQGDWQNSRKYVVANEHNHWHGHATGRLVDHDSGHDVTLDLVEVRADAF